MPQYGNITDPSRPILKEVNRIIASGFDFAEISIEGPEGTPEILQANQSEIIDLIRSHGSFATGHIVWWAELGSSYDGVRNAWIRQVRDAIEVARRLQLKKLNVHSHVRGLYLQHKTARVQTLQIMTESLRGLVEFATEQGIGLMLENSASKRDISKYDDFKDVAEGITDLGIHVDVAHAYLHGGLVHIDQFLRGFRDRLEHVHVSDNHGKDDEHLPIGEGKINFERVVKTLKRIKYDGTITFEIFQKKKDGLPRSLTTFKRLWGRI